jgi:hypothetical protein
MTGRKECTIYLVAGSEGYEVSTELESAHELYGDNISSYGARRVFKLSIVLPDSTTGGDFELTVKPAGE